eukprot:gnl/TRDRNA2_/TRDRNA2_72362_c0_seq2.p2 gnl/TRDRNA2_/TRDRNA2_72362_c0~~gnl/TRDRNA2_/TRDRNA2_72362_c0_seq2.p2  ORF type:complete len:176 (-),score=17.10 gnl/TRDRNA2_/TRDRNA2_72362_c0_seq2:85-612(-)
MPTWARARNHFCPPFPAAPGKRNQSQFHNHCGRKSRAPNVSSAASSFNSRVIFFPAAISSTSSAAAVALNAAADNLSASELSIASAAFAARGNANSKNLASLIDVESHRDNLRNPIVFEPSASSSHLFAISALSAAFKRLSVASWITSFAYFTSALASAALSAAILDAVNICISL